MRVAPRKNRSAFTLVEILAVLVIVGILASIILPRFGTSKNKASFAAAKSDLHNLTTMEEAFFYDYQRYTTDLDSLQFVVSRGVVLTVEEATNSGWSAKAYHPDAWPHICSIFVGSATALPPATAAGALDCK
jgi:prepilin-type N-terminal cleavage/methylation domain-containing protein